MTIPIISLIEKWSQISEQSGRKPQHWRNTAVLQNSVTIIVGNGALMCPLTQKGTVIMDLEDMLKSSCAVKAKYSSVLENHSPQYLSPHSCSPKHCGETTDKWQL